MVNEMRLRGGAYGGNEVPSCSGRDLPSQFNPASFAFYHYGANAFSTSYVIRPTRVCKARQRSHYLQARCAVDFDSRTAQVPGICKEPGPHFIVPTYVTAPGRVVASKRTSWNLLGYDQRRCKSDALV